MGGLLRGLRWKDVNAKEQFLVPGVCVDMQLLCQDFAKSGAQKTELLIKRVARRPRKETEIASKTSRMELSIV